MERFDSSREKLSERILGVAAFRCQAMRDAALTDKRHKIHYTRQYSPAFLVLHLGNASVSLQSNIDLT